MERKAVSSNLVKTGPGELNVPLFSIITVVYNAADTIRETVESVLSQIWTNYEYIVVDGGSTDGTAEILRTYQARFTRFVSEPDAGIYDAMNKGLALANGEYSLYLNADDTLINETVLRDIRAIIEYHRVSIDVLSAAVMVDYGDYEILRYAAFSCRNLKRSKMPPHQGLVVRTSILRELNGFDSSFRSSADFDMLCRLKTYSPVSVNRDLIVARMRAGGMSSDKTITYKEKTNILRSHFGFFWALRYCVLKIVFEQQIKRLLAFLLPSRHYNKLRRSYLKQLR